MVDQLCQYQSKMGQQISREHLRRSRECPRFLTTGSPAKNGRFAFSPGIDTSHVQHLVGDEPRRTPVWLRIGIIYVGDTLNVSKIACVGSYTQQ
ncbi:hypothetical protein AXK56_11625 [Tsukamurella pulmonis]|nr:hypothetical protein AXK56_11625 [Tsukamurella pulmonis]